MKKNYDVVIVGGGFTGISTALTLSGNGLSVCLIEKDAELGGLAGSFYVGNTRLEKFYHHWFTSDLEILGMIKKIHKEDQIRYIPSNTGMYYANKIFRLSSPIDLLRFTPLSFIGRIRLGLLALRVRKIHDWKPLESLTAKEWLISQCGKEVYEVVWEPLLKGKFGEFFERVSAVWMWNKLKLRGSSRSKGGSESLAYYQGGFSSLVDSVAEHLKTNDVDLVINTQVERINHLKNDLVQVDLGSQSVYAKKVVLTTPLPIAKDLLPKDTVKSRDSIEYLSNICLVFVLNKSLSDTYWLNINDPSFPFVGVIEHTNFIDKSEYDGRHLVYLSKYLPKNSDLYKMSKDEYIDFAMPHLQKMFPDFSKEWIHEAHFWKADYSQPIIDKHYSKKIPSDEPVRGRVFLATMAQIYPEDRGTNYAVRSGRLMAEKILKQFSSNRS